MAVENLCPHCGKSLPTSVLGGICPECMLKAGLLQTEAGNAPGGSKIEPPRPEEIAPLFPQLELLECLGRGGMGAVYKARQPRLNRYVALKILVRERECDPKFTERFTREAQALARLSHPDIVAVYDFGEVAGLCYLLMEFVDGMTLRQLLLRGKLPADQALSIVPRVCEALQFAHEHGVVHRDIKPENILLDKKGRVKIADFGIAKMVGGESGRTNLTDEKQVMGTPHYMAPEQVEKPQEVDHRADIYSLGVVFYEMLTGELPLGKFQPPSRKVQLDGRLDEVVLHALEKEPERRYQRASEVKSDVETIATTQARPHETDAKPATQRGPPWSHTAAAATAALALIVCGILVSTHLMTHKQYVAPVITGFEPTSGSSGTKVVIHGSNFDPIPSKDIVHLGPTRATVAAASPNSLTIIVPTSTMYAPVTVAVDGVVASSSEFFKPTFSGNSTSLSSSSFAPRIDIETPAGPIRLAIADFNGDGKPDLAVANGYAHTISIYENVSSNGKLTADSFRPPIVIPFTSKQIEDPMWLTAADVDGDGKIDLVAPAEASNQIIVYRNISTGGPLTPKSFAPPVGFAVGRGPRNAVVADFDGDGKPDIACANIGDNTVSILRNIGTAGVIDSRSFASPVTLPLGLAPHDLAVGDLDGDGKPDLAVINYEGGLISIFRNISKPGEMNTNSFGPRVDLSAPVSASSIALGDLDGDGKLDLLVGFTRGNNKVLVYRNLSSPGTLSAKSFSEPTVFPAPGWISSVTMGDLSGSGKLDIAVVDQMPSTLSIFQNVGAGPFNESSLKPRLDLVPGQNPYSVQIVDLDGDGRPDIVFVNCYSNSLSIFQNVTGWRESQLVERPSRFQ